MNRALLIWPVILMLLTGCGAKEHSLPYFFPAGLGKYASDTIYQELPSFDWPTQDGSSFTRQDAKGKILVIHLFHTDCRNLCEKVLEQTNKIKDRWKDSSAVYILSLSVNPESDSVPALNSYAEKYGISGNHLLASGKPERVGTIIHNSFHLQFLQDSLAPDGWYIDNRLLLIDMEGFTRGIYRGTKDEEIQKLINDIGILLNEQDQK